MSAMGKLNFVDPVPADIEIAQSVTPTPITEIARQLDIRPDDFEPHGTTKAKVRTRRPVIRGCRCFSASCQVDGIHVICTGTAAPSPCLANQSSVARGTMTEQYRRSCTGEAVCAGQSEERAQRELW